MTRPGHGRGRKPIDKMAAVGQPAPQDAIWRAIRSLGEFTRAELCKQIYKEQGRSVNDDTVRSYIDRLIAGGFVELEREERLHGNAVRKHFRLVGEGAPVEAPRLTKDGKQVVQGRATENMWRTMKIMGEFTARDLAVHATTEEVAVSEVAAKHYCKHLHRAGYLVVTRPNNGCHTLASYRLIPSKYTGPRAPMVQRIKAVFDPNLQQIVWPEPQS